jgi:glycosyltransferase involved in cell wall biosynthesis
MSVQTNNDHVSRKPRLLFALNSSIALNFIQGQPEYFQEKGFDVAVVCPPRRQGEWDVPRSGTIPILELRMEREIAPLRDVASLWRLLSIMRSVSPTIVNVGTPKAGLLGGLAAWLNRVPCRFYTLHGLRFETTKGLRRRLLVFVERLTCRLAHRVICVSNSVREKGIAAGLADRERMLVLGPGSCNGVDAERFAATPERIKRAAGLRQALGIPMSAPVLLFVGRFTRDKGIPELITAFHQLAPRFPQLRLVLAGCYEEGDPLPGEIRRMLETHPRVIFAGAMKDIEICYLMADVVVLPSHREGLPTVVLEAQAAGKPVIGASATGIVDVIQHEETGLLFPIGDIPALAKSIARVIEDQTLAQKLADAGREQVICNFGQRQIWEALSREYLRVLQTRKRALSLKPYHGRSTQLIAGPGK